MAMNIEGRDTDRQTWWCVCGMSLLALVLFAMVAYRAMDVSSRYGRLAVSPLYDDVVYMLDAVKWMDASAGRSVAGNVLALLNQHAPFSSLVAAIGLQLFPGGYTGPYLVSSVVVLAFLLGLVWLTRTRPAWEVATALIAAACVPTVWHTATEARPDLPWGLALGIALGAIVQRNVLRRSTWSLVVLGIGCGIAGSIKPTAFPASLAAIGSIFVIRLLVDCAQDGGFRKAHRRTIEVLLTFGLAWLLTMAVLIGPALVHTIDYIWRVFVSQRDIWSTGEGFWSGLAHFSIGAEGRAGLHFWFWAGCALMAMRLSLAALQSRAAVQDALVLVAALLIAYAIPSVAEIKTYFFGSIFYGLFIVAMALNYCAIQDGLVARLNHRRTMTANGRRMLWLARAAPLVVVAMLFGRNIVTGRIGLATPLSPTQQADISLATDRVWKLVRETSNAGAGPLRIGFSNAYPVTPTTLELFAAQARLPIIAGHEFYHRSVDTTERALLQANLIVITSSMPHTLPGPRAGDELIQRMDANTSVCLAEALDFPDVRFRVYRRPC
jgi:hypothetical protein